MQRVKGQLNLKMSGTNTGCYFEPISNNSQQSKSVYLSTEVLI